MLRRTTRMTNRIRMPPPSVLSFTVVASVVALLLWSVSTNAWTVRPVASTARRTSRTAVQSTQNAQTTVSNESSDASNPYGLTPELLKIATSFESIGDDKLRYKQLLFMANQLAPMDPASQIPENKVPGCLSTVFIDGTCTMDALNGGSGDDATPRIHFVGDSDGLLTKGLVALLVRGLSGHTAADIQKVDAAFIQSAGIAASLTPGRNNGFLNMLRVMKRKALELEQAATANAPGTSAANSDTVDATRSDDTANDAPSKYTAIVAALQLLQPTVLDLKDVSYQHAGHAQAGNGVETHFELDIVADAFEGLNLVKRHKLVYMMLGTVMPSIHALQIRAKTPAEVE